MKVDEVERDGDKLKVILKAESLREARHMQESGVRSAASKMKKHPHVEVDRIKTDSPRSFSARATITWGYVTDDTLKREFGTSDSKKLGKRILDNYWSALSL